MADGVEPWMAIDYGEVLQALAETKQMELALCRDGMAKLLRVSKEETEQWLSPGVGCVGNR
jgi:CRISPR-associated endonuclease/helicase Cas3